MTQGEILTVLKEALSMAFLLAAPVLVTSVVVGLIVSVFQAATQVHEQTLSFVPKIIAIALILVACGPWMLSRLTEFTQRLFELALSLK